MSVPGSLHVRRVLVDSAAYFAIANDRSPDHGRAVAVSTQLAEEHRPLYTTNFIVAETHALVLSCAGRDLAAQVLASVDASDTTISPVEEVDEARAREIIFSHTDKDYSLTDTISFAVMERLHIGTAFTFDRHFVQFGFAVLGLDES